MLEGSAYQDLGRWMKLGAQKGFAKYDADGDGHITLQELGQAVALTLNLTLNLNLNLNLTGAGCGRLPLLLPRPGIDQEDGEAGHSGQ